VVVHGSGGVGSKIGALCTINALLQGNQRQSFLSSDAYGRQGNPYCHLAHWRGPIITPLSLHFLYYGIYTLRAQIEWMWTLHYTMEIGKRQTNPLATHLTNVHVILGRLRWILRRDI